MGPDPECQAALALRNENECVNLGKYSVPVGRKRLKNKGITEMKALPCTIYPCSALTSSNPDSMRIDLILLVINDMTC